MQKVPVEKRRKRVFCMREIFDLYSYLKISGAQAAGRRLKAREAGIHVPVFLQADISVLAICPVQVVRTVIFIRNIRKSS